MALLKSFAALLFVLFLLAPVPSMAESSHSGFVPEPVFKITNLARTVDLVKSYVRESLALVVQNIDSKPQDEFYVAVRSDDEYGKVVFLDVKEKRDDPPVSLEIEKSSINKDMSAQFYKIVLTEPVLPGRSVNIQIVTAVLDALNPQPKAIKQPEAQHLVWTGSRFAFLPYEVARQRTTVKLPDRGANAYSKSSTDPTVDGTTLTYGPYSNSAPFSNDPIRVRYEYHFPVVEVTKLERELWVSHYGGNLATEERYAMTNAAATLSENFSRLRWQASRMTQERSTAVKGFNIHLRPGARDVYFTDEIGNVSTSNFRPSPRDPTIDIRPRYPIFGGWNSTFTLGWNHDLGRNLKVLAEENAVSTYLLRVPLLEGPDNSVYKSAEVSVVLPEGATVVDVFCTYKDYTKEELLVKSQLDTIGRTVVKLTANDIVDEHRRNEIYVTYQYSSTSSLHKPLLVSSAIAAVFLAVIILGRIDFKIAK